MTSKLSIINTEFDLGQDKAIRVGNFVIKKSTNNSLKVYCFSKDALDSLTDLEVDVTKTPVIEVDSYLPNFFSIKQENLDIAGGSGGDGNITYPESPYVIHLQTKSLNVDSVEYKTINAIKKVLGEPKHLIDLSRPLQDQFDIDSLDCVEISLELEDTFAIDFDSTLNKAIQPEMTVNFITSKIEYELKKKKETSEIDDLLTKKIIDRSIKF